MILSSLRTLLETGGRYPSSSLSRTAECAGVRCDAVTILRRRDDLAQSVECFDWRGVGEFGGSPRGYSAGDRAAKPGA